jgi:hypothetical protein
LVEPNNHHKKKAKQMQTTLLPDHIELAFKEFHAKHPEVYEQLVRLARQWVAAGHAHLGIATLYERLRWEWHVNGLRDRDGYKLNNNYKALYARMIMANNPDLDGLFHLRERTAI